MYLQGLILLTGLCIQVQEHLKISDQGYFHRKGLYVTFFSEYYPEGHQSGVSIIQHGVRVATNYMFLVLAVNALYQ